MLKLIIISLIAVTSVLSKNVNKVCPDKDLPSLNFDQITKGTWFEIYASRTNPKVECTSVMFMKKDSTITVHHEGKIGDKKEPTHIVGNIRKDFKSLYDLTSNNKTYQSIILYNDASYAVIHECTNNSTDSTSISSFFILGRKPSLSYMDFIKINVDLTSDAIGVKEFFEPNELKITNHFDKKCNSGTSTQVLTGLIVTCLALIKFF